MVSRIYVRPLTATNHSSFRKIKTCDLRRHLHSHTYVHKHLCNLIFLNNWEYRFNKTSARCKICVSFIKRVIIHITGCFLHKPVKHGVVAFEMSFSSLRTSTWNWNILANWGTCRNFNECWKVLYNFNRQKFLVTHNGGLNSGSQLLIKWFYKWVITWASVFFLW